MSGGSLLEEHPLLRCLATVRGALDDVEELDPTYLPTGGKARALLDAERELARLDGLRLRLIAAAADVALEEGARSAGVWAALETRAGAPAGVRAQRLAEGLERWTGVGAALRAGSLNSAQATVIVDALDRLPEDLEVGLAERAVGRLVADAREFGPRELRVLGRRVLEAVAPEVAEAEEERLVRAEEERGSSETRLGFRARGDGLTDVVATLPDHVADRLRVCLDAYTSPRRDGMRDPGGDVERLPMPRRRGEAFCALLEAMPADRLPVHGGTATAVMVSIDLAALETGLGLAELSTGGRITATEARRLACTAKILPVVLGGAGEVLDLGRARRLFSPAQRKALALRDRHCRAEGCDIPAAWCEAHHAERPWSHGGSTDLADGVLLCSFHHHRAHDARWRAARLPSGDVRYTRRT